MFFIFCLVNSFLFLTAEGASKCNDFTLSSCSYDEKQLIKEVHTDSEDYCQETFCHKQYKDDCKYYVYVPASKTCGLYKDEIKTLFESCTVIGGPKEPLVNDCIDQEEPDPCDTFIDGECTLGDKIEQFEDIEEVTLCQEFCGTITGCSYFVHNKENKDCTLYSTNAADCKELRGPPTPPNADC